MANDPKNAKDLADKLGIKGDPWDRTDYYGADNVRQDNAADALSASKGFEESSGGNQGSTGGCGQSVDNAPSKDEK